MLIVSRSVHESLVVGEFEGFERGLKFTILEIRDGHVILGVEIEDELPPLAAHRSVAWKAWHNAELLQPGPHSGRGSRGRSDQGEYDGGQLIRAGLREAAQGMHRKGRSSL